jgi:sugar phosphate permease
MPFVGRQIDKRGPRVVVGVVAVLFALACVYMSFVQSAVMLGIGFFFIRMLGQGSMSIVSGNILNQWWVRRRGLILSIAGVVSSLLGSGSFPTLINILIERFGWRGSYQVLGLAVAVIMVPVGQLFYKRRPEDYGLLPDGEKTRPSAGSVGVGMDVSGQSAFVEENWTSREAVRTAAFWIIGLGLGSISMLSTGLQFHMVSIFADAGLAIQVAAGAFMSVALMGALVRIISGVLVDRIPARFLLFVALLGQTAALLIAPHLNSFTAGIYGLVLGATGSLQMTVSSVIWAKYFGRKHLGSITGVAAVLNVGGSALGPMPMGIARDLFGNYTLGLTILAVLPFALGIVALFSRRPQRGEQEYNT